MSFEERKAAWLALYEGKRKRVVMINFDEGERPWPYPENKTQRIEYALKTYRTQCLRAQWLHDDRVPFLAPYTGTEIFAQAFGCRVHYSGDNMPFALPLVQSAKEAAKLTVPEVESSLHEIFEIADELRRAEPDGLLSLPDIQSPIDIAALIWDKADFYPAMLDEPEAVLELTGKIYEFLTGFLDMWFERYGREFIAHYPDYYMPYGITLSEDEIGALSPGMFIEFCLPELNALSERYGAIGMHCCANSEHQWQNFKKIKNLKALNLVQPEDVLERAYGVFKDTCIQMHSIPNVREDGAFYLPESARDGRIVLHAKAENQEDAINKLNIIRDGE